MRMHLLEDGYLAWCGAQTTNGNYSFTTSDVDCMRCLRKVARLGQKAEQRIAELEKAAQYVLKEPAE